MLKVLTKELMHSLAPSVMMVWGYFIRLCIFYILLVVHGQMIRNE